MGTRDDRQDERDRELDRGSEALETALSEILEESGSERNGTRSEGKDDARPEPADPEEIASLLNENSEGDPGTEPDDISQEDMDRLQDDAYASGRRLARVGDCVLMVSEDGMRATFRGQMPEGTTFQDVVQVLEEAGIRFGIIQNRIPAVLPRKPVRRRAGRRRSAPGPEPSEVVVAAGQAPVSPPEARVEYRFHQVDAEAVKQVQTILEGYSFAAVKTGSVALSFVRPGQVLAEVIQDGGQCGRNVFGEELPPPRPVEATLKAGENVALSEDGQSATATGYGYGGRVDGQIAVFSPIWITQDLMRTFFVALPQEKDFPALRVVEIEEMLQQSGIAHGVLAEAIEAFCAGLRRGKPVERLTLIARGAEATPGQDAAWQFACDPQLTRYFGQIQRLFARSPDVPRLEEETRDLAGKAVSAGERLAAKQPPIPGEMGRDVFGEEFMPDEPEDVVLEGDENVCFAEDGMACFAGIFGYLGIGVQGNRVELISPLWVARDQMAAYFVNLPPLGERRTPTFEEIDALLEQAGVRYGVAHRNIGVLCEKLEQGLPVELTVCLARGKAPQPGQDGGFDFAVDRERPPGFFRPDGSVDFKQLNLAPLVAEGQEIGRRKEATPGSPGTDVTGRERPARDGQEVGVDIGQHVRLMREEGQADRYLSEVEGELVVVERLEPPQPVIHLAVHRVRHVDGDVDFHTGHIDFPGSVHVAGSIRSGFAVKAEGNVVVGDSVEDGGAIEAGGNVAVKNGIAGGKTRVTAAGDVLARYINEAQVRTRGDIHIAEYIFNASVRADGEIAVWGATGARTSGLIVGGTAMAGKKISARAVGTPAAPPARLLAGVDAGLLKQTADEQQRIDQYSEATGKVLRSLQVERMPPAQIRQVLLNLVLKAKGPKKKLIARAVKNLLELQARLEKAVARKNVLDGQLEQLAA